MTCLRIVELVAPLKALFYRFDVVAHSTIIRRHLSRSVSCTHPLASSVMDKTRILTGLKATLSNPLTSGAHGLCQLFERHHTSAQNKASEKRERRWNESSRIPIRRYSSQVRRRSRQESLAREGVCLRNSNRRTDRSVPTKRPSATREQDVRSCRSWSCRIGVHQLSAEAKEQALHEIEQIGSQADVEHAHKDMDAPLPERQSGEAAVAEANNRCARCSAAA